jgi:hypothetical protein
MQKIFDILQQKHAVLEDLSVFESEKTNLYLCNLTIPDRAYEIR